MVNPCPPSNIRRVGKKRPETLDRWKERSNELLSSVEIAKKRGMARILRGKHTQRKKCVPYHQALRILLVALFLARVSTQ